MGRHADYVKRVNAVVNHVAADPNQPYSVADLAQIANFSTFHFHRIFQSIAGESVADMVARLRLEAAAATLLYQPALTITRVAMDHGYSSAANFSKAFSNHFGCSPSRYRQTNSRVENSKNGKAVADMLGHNSAQHNRVEIVHQPSVELAYLRTRGSYEQENIARLHNEVTRWVEAQGCATEPSLSLGITWSDSHIAAEEHWRYDACRSVVAGTQGTGMVNVQSLPPLWTAQLLVVLEAGESHDLRQHWQYLLGVWLPQTAYELAACPSFEIYAQATDAAQFAVRLCLPLNLS